MAFDPKKYLAEKTGKESSPAQEEQSLGIGDIARPLIQGGTLGFSDEAAGGLGALRDLITGKTGLDMDAIKQAYESSRDQERQLNEDTEKRNPNLYKALEFAGGLATPVGTIGKAAKGASLAAKAGKLALEGGILGGTAGAGFSKGENLSDVGEDALGGAALGALPGAVLGGAAGIAKLGEHIPLFGIGKASQGIEQGLMGNVPGNVKFTDSVENLLGKLGDKKKGLSEAYENLLTAAEENGSKIDSNSLDNLLKELHLEARSNKSPEVQKDIQKVTNLVNSYIKENKLVETMGKPFISKGPNSHIEEGLLDSAGNSISKGKEQFNVPTESKQIQVNRELSPREAQNLKSSLGEQAKFSATNPALETAEGRQFAKSLKENASDVLGDNVPGIKQTDSQYADLENVMRQLGVKSEKLYTKNALTGELEIDPKALNVVQTMLKRSVNEKASGDVAKKSVDLLSQGMEKLKIGSPEDMRALLDKAKSSNVFDKPISKAASYLGYGAQKGLTAQPTVRALSMAPEAVDAYDRKPHNSYSLSKDVKNASKQELHQLANTAMTIKGLEQQGESLKKAVTDGNLRAVNQLMFDLLQRPKFRDSVEGVVSDKETDKE